MARKKKRNGKKKPDKSIARRLEIYASQGKWSPIYVVDTSGILHMREQDPRLFQDFVQRNAVMKQDTTTGVSYPGILVLPSVLDEILDQYETQRGRRKMIELRETLPLILASQAGRTLSMPDRIEGHSMYERHWDAAFGTYQLLERERIEAGGKSRGPISDTDLEILTAAFTLSRNSRSFGFRRVFPVIVSGDRHITETAIAMSRYEKHSDPKYKNSVVVLDTRPSR